MVKTALEIIFENDHFIVINKPPGLLSIPDRDGVEIFFYQGFIELYFVDLFDLVAGV